MSSFLDILSTAGATAALIGGAAFLTKALVQNQLTKDLEEFKRDLQRDQQLEIESYKAAVLQDIESHKARLLLQNTQALDAAKFEFEKELILHRGEVDLVKEGYRYSAESEKQRNERLRSQVQRWALPIQGAIADLSHRLEDILTDDGYLPLSSTYKKVEGWSADYDYFMPSTLYYFAQYFCWTRLLQQQLGHELFQSGEEMGAYFEIMDQASQSVGRFPYYKEKGDPSDAVNRQVFRLQQRAIGELLISNAGAGENILTYREFLDRWMKKDDEVFSRHIAPLELFLRDLSPTNDLRWTRLHDMNNRLHKFEQACQEILRPSVAETDA